MNERLDALIRDHPGELESFLMGMDDAGFDKIKDIRLPNMSDAENKEIINDLRKIRAYNIWVKNLINDEAKKDLIERMWLDNMVVSVKDRSFHVVLYDRQSDHVQRWAHFCPQRI